jgi:F-type H+-transporting ATPase subunit delta
MSEQRAAYRYAKALLDLAQEQKKVKEVEADMHLVRETIQENDSLKEVLQSPILEAADKKDALSALFKTADPLTGKLFQLLSDKKRIPILGEVAAQFIALSEQLKGQEIARVITAVPLNAALEEKILGQLKAITGKEVVLEQRVDPDLIGGFILRVGDLEYNASLSGKLDHLKRELLQK